MEDDQREPPQFIGQIEADLGDAREVLDLNENDHGRLVVEHF